jgi:hypothetical protein
MNHRHTVYLAARQQRGLAATGAALLLFFAMGIIIAFTNRSLIFEQRTSANQYRYTKAFEAAEAGLEWAIANINNASKIDNACVANAGGVFFKARFTPLVNAYVTPNAAVTPACVISGGTYTCTCDAAASGAPNGSGPAFKVTFTPFPTQPGVVRVTVDGCTSSEGLCNPAAGGTPDGYAKVTALLGVLPALSTIPASTITAKSNVNWQGAGSGVGVVNTDPTTNGITINAGGSILPGNARITTIPGSPPLSSVIENDQSLATIGAESMFVTFFGMTKADFKALALNVTCPTNCTNTLDAAVASFGSSTPIIWVEGPMNIQSGTPIGSTANPVLLVINGDIEFGGNVQVTGLVYATSTTGTPPVWNITGGGSQFLRGAAVSEGSFIGNGTPDYYFDASVLTALTTVPGAFTKIPGSWKDY